ncbi:MAG: hypothetical protein HFH91_18370 [Lachnospiraceae bacterium]|nr:hypothetical protein [Lachnospiraceae bacterium]
MKIGNSGEKRAMHGGMWNMGTISVLLLGVVAASVPLMTDYILQGSDLQGTLSRIEAVSHGIGRAFPIRITPWASADYGYAAASFQADLFYVIPAVCKACGMGLSGAYKLTLFLANLATAFVAFGCLEKCLRKRETAVVGSLLFVWCPYRLHEMYVNGSLGDVMAWIFIPIVISALIGIYTMDREAEAYGKLWISLACGFSLLALSSTSVLVVTAGMSMMLFLFMGRASLHRKTLLAFGKATGVFLLINAWFLIPMVLRLRDDTNVGITIPGDFRSLGVFPIQYLRIFLWGGDGRNFGGNGMAGAAALCPGIAVVLPVIFYIWTLYEGGYRHKDAWNCLGKRLLWVCMVLVFLSSNIFPWNLFQNRNLLFSILLSLVQNPAKWGIPVCALMIAIACLTLEGAFFRETEERYRMAVLTVGGISFATAQFLLGNILRTRDYVRPEELQELLLPLHVLDQESVVWRCSEFISLAALCAVVAMAVRRRYKG